MNPPLPPGVTAHTLTVRPQTGCAWREARPLYGSRASTLRAGALLGQARVLKLGLGSLLPPHEVVGAVRSLHPGKQKRLSRHL